MTILILIRHAPTQPDKMMPSDQWKLTDDSQNLCDTLAAQLTVYDISRLIISYEPKAKQTGQYIANSLDSVPISAAKNLHETERQSKLFYQSQKAFREAVITAMQTPDDLVFGDETFTHARQRFSDALQKTADKYPNETIGIVSHGRILSLYLATLMELSCVAIWRRLKMPAYAVLDWETQIITKIVYQIEEHPHD